MCHRILRYILNTQCTHKTFTGDTMIDCQDPTCGNSRAHPANCLNCTHNRWFGSFSFVTDKLLHMHRLDLMGLTGLILTSTSHPTVNPKGSSHKKSTSDVQTASKLKSLTHVCNDSV